MNQKYNWGDNVWVDGNLKGIVTDIDNEDTSQTGILRYWVDTLDFQGSMSGAWKDSDSLTPRLASLVLPTQSDPIESAVSAMATEPTSRSSGWTAQWLNMAIDMLSLSVADYHKLLGEDYPAKAIEAALPLLRNVRDELN